MGGRRITTGMVVRFWERVQKSSGCWLWSGFRDRAGYGRFKGPGNIQHAHRTSWVFERGPIPKGLFVCHHCDNPPCVNPEHLFLGTSADNTRDRDRKGRQARGERHGSRTMPEMVPKGNRHASHLHPELRQGESNGRARLTEEEVFEIRSLYRRGAKPSIRDLAENYNVSKSTIGYVVSGGTWR